MPDLRLTSEKREQLRRLTEAVEHGTAPVITHEADLAARAFREIEWLERQRDEARAEVERLRELLGEARVIVAVMADPNAYAPWRRKFARALLPQIDAALAASGQEGATT